MSPELPSGILSSLTAGNPEVNISRARVLLNRDLPEVDPGNIFRPDYSPAENPTAVTLMSTPAEGSILIAVLSENRRGTGK